MSILGRSKITILMSGSDFKDLSRIEYMRTECPVIFNKSASLRMPTPFCPECNNEVQSFYNFCPGCGKALSWDKFDAYAEEVKSKIIKANKNDL